MRENGVIYNYEKNFLKYDLIISIFITIGFFIFIQNNNDISLTVLNNISNTYDVILSISITMLGFIITGVSILVVFLERESLALFHKSKSYSLIYKVYFSTITYLAILTIFSLLACGLKPIGQMYFNYIIFFLSIVSILRIYRCVWILKRIIDAFIQEKSIQTQLN